MTRVQWFFIGNLLGLLALAITVIVTAPQKLKEPSPLDTNHGSEKINVVVVVKDMQAGQEIKAVNLEEAIRHRNEAPKEALGSIEEAKGRRLSNFVKAGSVLSKHDIEEESSQ